ncbi:hypothetical protein [uncultured Shewanella sp.]|uniref:hypothetical protein n=1 Tax=uncultured Shewanella sp. TaxID=173975 RepID=UPI002625E3BB|nr:hypothetical protein [uncultured Shewanella sp.]
MKFTLLCWASLLFTLPVVAGDIAFGTLKGIKVYDQSTKKVTELHFSDDAGLQKVEGCNGVARITHSLHSEVSVNQMTSLAIAAYMSGKKVRANSAGDTCEMDFLAIQETSF